MAAAAHPPETLQILGPSPAPPPSCPWQSWAAPLFSALEAGPPCGDAGQRAHGGTRIPCPRAFARVPAREHLCTAILDSLPQSLPPRGDSGKGEGTRGAGVQPQPRRGPGAELARGEIRKDARENYNAQRLANLTSAGLGALPPRHTPPRSDTQKAAPAAGAGRSPRGPATGGREGGDPGRAGGRRAAAEGAGGREGGGKMELGPYLSTDCSFSSSFFCRSMTARMIFLSSSVRWLRSGISGCRGG